MVFHNKKSHFTFAAKNRNKASKYVLCALCPKNATKPIDRLIRWERPSNCWLKLNTDGSSLGNPKLTSGGILRDERGNWVIGFSRKTGRSSSYLAELWTIRDGLNICLSKNFLDVEVELDAKIIVNALTNPHLPNSSQFPLMDDCK